VVGAVLVVIAAVLQPPMAGNLPSHVDGGARVVWIDAATGDAVPCTVDGRRWSCPPPAPDARGIVLSISSGRLAIAGSVGVDGVDSSPAAWGRVIRVVPGSAAATDLHDLTLLPWKPERSVVRIRLRRFRAVRDESVRVIKLSATVFWVDAVDAVDRVEPVDPDAFLRLEGPEIGSARIATLRLSSDAPEAPFLVAAPLAMTVVGRVRNARGEDVASASVELLEPLKVDADPRDRLLADTPVVAGNSAVSGPDGSFRFDRVCAGPALLVATSPADGRGSAWVTDPGPPIEIVMIPPVRAQGRVLRNRLLLPGARIRFVPTQEAWAASGDPSRHLVDETTSADDGTFVLALPEEPAGELQVVAVDGATARVPLFAGPARTTEIALGDVSIPDPRRVVVRLLEGLQSPACDLIAAGPIGTLGMQIIRASSVINVYTLDLPESGQWVLSVECGGIARSVVPMVAIVPPAGTDGMVPTIDVRFVK
jgi:hypothetical protein